MKGSRALVLCVLLCACSSSDDASVSDAAIDSVDADTTDSVPPADGVPTVFGDLSCLGTTYWPPVTVSTVTLSGRVLDPLGFQDRIPNVTVDAHAATDTGFTTPLASYVSRSFLCPNGSTCGQYSLQLDVGASGLDVALRLTPMDPGQREGFFYQNQPLTIDTGLDPLVAPDDSLADLYRLVGLTEDPARGSLGVGVFDCNGSELPHATITITPMDATTNIAYFVGAFPRPDANATDSTGRIGVFNAPVGTVTVTAMALPGPGLPPVRVFQEDVTVVAGALTVLYGHPK